MKILLLEDNTTDADLTIRGLKKHFTECKIELAVTIAQATQLLSENTSFDVAILDLNLPDGNGLELLHKIRLQNLNIPVVMLTGTGDEETAVTALKSGADDYIVKKEGYISNLPNVIHLAIANFKKIDAFKSEFINVLYLEHHTIDINLTVRHLSKYAPFIHIDTVETGEQALDILTTDPSKYKVLLMDYRLQGMSAIDLIKTIRQNLQLCIPIILVTGQGTEELAVQALKLGANDYLTKDGDYLFRLPSIIINSYQHCELVFKQEALVKKEMKYRLLADNSGDVIFTLDMELRPTYMSPAIKSLRGFEPEEAINQDLNEVLTPSSYQIAKTSLTEMLSENLSSQEIKPIQKTVELELIKKDKNTIWTEVKASLVVDENNKPTGIVGVTRDISERKTISDELRKLSRAVEQSPVLIVITDTLGNIEYVNPKFTEITGYTLPEVVGKNTRILKSGYTDDLEYENLWKTITSGSEWQGEFQNKRKDGTLYWEEASISSIKNREGEITHFLAVKSDITERKKSISELIIAKEMAEESNRLKTAFLQNISHEIRTPMNGILGFIGLLKNPVLSGSDQEKYISIVEKSGQRLLNTINDLMEISKIESGTVELSMNPENIPEILQKEFDFFHYTAEKKGLTLKLNCHLNPSQMEVVTDSNKIHGILTNLINNALKFTEHGNIEFGCFPENNDFIFYVKDTGVGIPEIKHATIFERFVQADSKITRGHEGTGLGLSISKAYSELLGGKMWFESTVNTGTTFFFSIPNHSTTEKPKTISNQIQEQTILFEPGTQLLIAEDNETSFLYLETILTPTGIVVHHAQNGEEAIEALQNNPEIALVLMDVKMPVMDGLKATKKIRKFNPTIPIIAQTAFAFVTDKKNALEAGCTDYISKPINKENLFLLIKKYVTKP